MSNILAIVGRPNVGKSTLFNRLTESRHAIVDETSGVTRDRHYGKSDWNGIEFSIIDTGGYVTGSDDIFEEEIRKQVLLAMEEADVVLFLVDNSDGLTPMDSEIADLMRKSKKKVILAANKVDSMEKFVNANEFYALGMGKVFGVSAMTGTGTGDLLDEVVAHFNANAGPDMEELPKIAVIGKPNVGKSSLINTLLGVERHIVTPLAGTTRDSIYTRFSSFGFDFYLVDTAGLRKKTKVTDNIEFYSVMRAIRAIENSDVCILMIDATQGMDGQDLNIFRLIERNNKGAVIVVNKWDLVEKTRNIDIDYENVIKERIAPFSDVPVILTSVPKKQRIIKVLETAKKVYERRSLRISTSKLNEVFLPILQKNPPPMVKGKEVKMKYMTQIKTPYPSFTIFCNMPQYVRESYVRYVENQLRKMYDFTGSPVKVYFRQK